MRFWDSSAIVPLLVQQEATAAMKQLYRADPSIMAWWGSWVECASVVARLEREGALTPEGCDQALSRLDRLAAKWQEILAVDAIRDVARRFLRVHPLRAADALQLAAAFLGAEHEPSTLDLVCLDDRLVAAARREGFRLVRVAG